MANHEVIVISDDESEDESNDKDDVDIFTESDNDSTSFKRRALYRGVSTILSWWLQAINTAVISAAMIYMLLKQ